MRKNFNTKEKKQILNNNGLRCASCGMTLNEHIKKHGRKLEFHHEDKNRENNCIDNIKLLCRKCHLDKHKHDKKISKYNTRLIILDIPNELNKKLKIEKVNRELINLQETVIEILKEHLCKEGVKK